MKRETSFQVLSPVVKFMTILRAAFHKYGPSCDTRQKIDFVYILLIGSPQ